VTAPDDPDAGVPAHRGDFLAEQRAMARSAAVVDRSHRGVLAVPGDDRLSWLHLLLTQHVSELPDGAGTEALVLDANGRVLHHMLVAPGDAAALLDYLVKMRFWSKVEPRAADDLAVLSVVGPETSAVLASAGAPVPEGAHASAALPGGGLVRRMPWPGPDAADLLVPRAEKDAWLSRLAVAGARPAGTMAFEALRVEAGAPRLHRDTDDRTILGPVALALVKRSVPVAAELTAGVDDRGAPARIDPDSFTPDADAPPPGRAAQLRGLTGGTRPRK
jgi:folate-binding Fe-S cluster repair protein YgfZ